MASDSVVPAELNGQGPFRRALQSVKHWYSQLGTFTKIAGFVSAVIGACTAVAGAYTAIHDAIVHRDIIVSLVREADYDFSEQDYAQSWDADAKALKMSPDDATALALQSRIAMGWLEDGHLNTMSGATRFGDFADTLIVPLTRRAASSSVQGTELADLKAHIGWARFLRSRDGISGLRIAGEFDDALKVDPTNMYAHVMTGFFKLWQGGDLTDARVDFDAAMKSPRNPDFRDRLIMSALSNSHSDKNGLAALDYADQIRKAGRSLGASQRRELYNVYAQGVQDPEFLNHIATVMPPKDNIATLDWVMIGQNQQAQKWNATVIKAFFLEKEGDRNEALTLYKGVVAEIPPEQSGSLSDMARSQISRLTQKQ